MDISSGTAALNPNGCATANIAQFSRPRARTPLCVCVCSCKRARVFVHACLRACLAMFSLHAMHTHVPPRHSTQRYLQPIYIYNALRAAVPATNIHI